MKKKWQQRVALLLAFFMVLSYQIKHSRSPHYEILEGEDAYASYSGGLIYIGSERDYACCSLGEGDVFVVDERNGRDPNMRVCDSYRIRRSVERQEIVEVLCYYEECDPSRWERTEDSMLLEWWVHNESHDCGYRPESSVSVDFNNGDAEKYGNKVLQKIFR